MKLYFTTGKKRLALDTETKTYSVDYFYLGGWKDYIKISSLDRYNILAALMTDGYTESNNAF